MHTVESCWNSYISISYVSVVNPGVTCSTPAPITTSKQGIMITFQRGDIFDSGCNVLVNPVNTVGVMGAGLAREFALKYPDMVVGYKKSCSDGSIEKLGYYDFRIDELNAVLCVPTKRHWRSPSTLQMIERAVVVIDDYCIENQLKSVAIPALGCGLGGLSVTDVARVVHDRFVFSPIDAKFYLPREANK